jgi:exosome complex exonuclease DIS3/RRP44
VDPPGCTDIDDTLHCREIDGGIFEVGVHIADVSHYVRPRNALDEEAAKRGTTVYLADRRIDMIPAGLSSNLCSLHAGTEKLVFSCIWKMDKDAKILETKFYKGIIQSKAAMTYAEAQAKLNSKDTDEITQSLKRLSFLAQVLKKQRLENGALMLNTSEVSADGEADDDSEESHSMVEEFMLLANCSVAEFILSEFRDYAMLRRHPIPPPANFDALLLAAKTHGLTIVVDKGSKALNESLQNQDSSVRDIVKILTTRCMTQALYCCSGTTNPEEYGHFGLAKPIYTHFTSPIRRYADLVVHRLLAAAIKVEGVDPRLLDTKLMTDIADNINIRHRMAQYASRASHNIHKSKRLKGKMEEQNAFVMFVRRNAFQLFVPQYALEGFIFFPKEGGYIYSEKEGTVTFGNVVFRPLDKVVVTLSVAEDSDKVLFKLVQPYVESLCDRK